MDLTFAEGVALLDTGATSSAISARFVKELGLISIAKRPIMVATEQRLVDFYLFRLGVFPESTDTAPATSIPYIFAETDGFLINQSHDFDVILGMDVLRECDLRVGRNGKWSLAFG